MTTAEEYFKKGNSKSSLRDYRSAIEYYNKAIELKSDFADAYKNRALAKKLFGDLEGAKADSKKADELFK